MQITVSKNPRIQPKAVSNLNFTAYLDGADHNLDDHQACSLDSFENVVSRESSLSGRALWTRGYRAGRMSSVLPAGLCTVAAGVSMALGSSLSAGIFGALGLALGAQPIARKALIESSREPLWLGSKSFNLDQDTTKGRVDSTVDDRTFHHKTSASELSEFVEKSYRENPDAEQIIWVQGHGYGHQEVASMKASELASALRSANAASGLKPELLVLNSCLMGNLEALAHLKDSAESIIASEKVISVNALDGKSFLESATSQKLKGGELAPEFMRIARQRNAKAEQATSEIRIREAFTDWGKFKEDTRASLSEHKTLAHFDMKKLPALLNSLEELGNHFLEKPQHRKLAKKVKRSMEAIDTKRGYYDLGQFLTLVSEALPKSDEAFKNLLAKSEASRTDFVADFSAQKENPRSTGLSVQLQSGLTGFLLQPLATLRTPHRETPLPESWKKFVSQTF